MTTSTLTSVLIWLPIGAALVIWVLPLSRYATGSLALLVSLLEVGIWIEQAARFDFARGGLQFSTSYSLFQGSTLSDTAVFKPYRENVSASFNISQTDNPLAVFARLFGKAVPEAEKAPVPATDQVRPRPDDALARQVAAMPVAGSGSRGERFLVPPSQGWRASFSLTSSRPRPPVGSNVIDYDPRVRCTQIAAGNPFLFDTCIAQQRLQPTTDTPVQSTTLGGQAYRIPATTSLGNPLAAFQLKLGPFARQASPRPAVPIHRVSFGSV